MTRRNGWHVLYVQYRHEKKVYDELCEKGLDAFLPMVTTVRRWSDRKKKVETPLFPSYVFVNIKSDRDFHDALSAESPCSYVSFGNEYGCVSKKEIDQLKLLVRGKDISDLRRNVKLPSIGDRLKIKYGELSGLECEVYRVDNVQKISVWLSALRQNISATIPAHYLQNALSV